MRPLVPATLVAICLAPPAGSAPEPPLVASPATASPAVIAERSYGLAGLTLKDPETASILSGGIPLAAVGLPLAASLGGLGPWLVLPGMAVGPLMVVSGYTYAEDPVRGVLVTLGAYGVEVAGGIAGAAIGGRANGAFAGLTGLVTGSALALAAYSVWTWNDAAQTAERRNQRKRQELATR